MFAGARCLESGDVHAATHLAGHAVLSVAMGHDLPIISVSLDEGLAFGPPGTEPMQSLTWHESVPGYIEQLIIMAAGGADAEFELLGEITFRSGCPACGMVRGAAFVCDTSLLRSEREVRGVVAACGLRATWAARLYRPAISAVADRLLLRRVSSGPEIVETIDDAFAADLGLQERIGIRSVFITIEQTSACVFRNDQIPRVTMTLESPCRLGKRARQPPTGTTRRWAHRGGASATS